MENLDKDRLQAISVGMQAYAMKIDLLTNATQNLEALKMSRDVNVAKFKYCQKLLGQEPKDPGMGETIKDQNRLCF